MRGAAPRPSGKLPSCTCQVLVHVYFIYKYACIYNTIRLFPGTQYTLHDSPYICIYLYVTGSFKCRLYSVCFTLSLLRYLLGFCTQTLRLHVGKVSMTISSSIIGFRAFTVLEFRVTLARRVHRFGFGV